MSIADKITALGNAKTAIVAAIRAKGGTVSDGNGFSDFATDIATIPSGGTDTRFDELIDGSISGDIVSNATVVKSYLFMNTSINSFTNELCTEVCQQSFFGCSQLTQVALPQLTIVGYGCFRTATSLTKLDCIVTSIDTASFHSSALNQLILRGTTVCTLANVNAFLYTPIASGTGYIYVPDNLVDSYKSATNWSTYALQIRGISQLEVTP